jgi:hypothetical protein
MKLSQLTSCLLWASVSYVCAVGICVGVSVGARVFLAEVAPMSMFSHARSLNCHK